jgi:ammonia channel protein AmtB
MFFLLQLEPFGILSFSALDGGGGWLDTIGVKDSAGGRVIHTSAAHEIFNRK